MRVHTVVVDLNEVDSDVGAVVGYPLEIRKQILEDKSKLDGALSGAQTLDVSGFQLVATGR